MSRAPIDLDAIEADARHTGARPSVAQTLALVAEVRRLRAELERAHHVVGAQAMRSMGIEPG